MTCLWGVASFLVVSLHLLQAFDYASGSNKGTAQRELEYKIRSAANLEELLRLTHPRELKLWRCRSKLKSYINTDTRSGPHRSTRFAAAFYDIEILTVIDEEWQKTQCMPRETCIDVAKDLGTATNKFFKPPCVSVYRCGGCCNEEGVTCLNTSTSYVLKSVFQISVPLTQAPEPVTIKVANHTSCKCSLVGPRHPPTIIRRSVPYLEYGCLQDNRHCPPGWQWDNSQCACVLENKSSLNRRREEVALCGANMEFEDSCECVCKLECSRSQVLNKENCTCNECSENLDSCCEKNKIFHPDSCSCKDDCPFQAIVCPGGRKVCSKHFDCVRREPFSYHNNENP
ncbi:PREDICTED: vascular endothelial growth factor D [Nanorana parkeri]|uniref:vascular endothelial growth factor D n=1 Tax=Nanorana parkeri TaxID=125878 RepID=UPI0008545D8E|nr:PREDICTED: vascular endothelial growth factor D [Nanorana parkeri]